MRWFVKSRRAQNVNDYETWVEGGVSPTLNAFDNGNDTRATVLIFTAQRVGEPPRIYQDITPSLLSRMGTGGNNTPMIVDPLYSFDTQLRNNGSGMAVATNFDEYNFTGGQDIHHQIRAGTRQSTGVLQDTVVRRLTPIECERLMGWPDNHTLHRADGKTSSDSTRYKMCGNGVASPVAKWIGEHLLPLLGNE